MLPAERPLRYLWLAMVRNFLITGIFCLLSVFALAQKARIYNRGKSMYTLERHKAPPKVTGAKAKAICPIFEKAKYPYQGFGIKLGDPFAITYKYYANEHFAIAIDAGKPSSSLYNGYFKEKFANYIVTDTFSTAEAGIEYYTHKIASDIIVEGRLLYSIDVQKVAPGLQVYVGVGWEWRNTKIEYDYTYSKHNDGNPDMFGRFHRVRQTMGPQVVGGLEYAHFSIPIAVFMEMEYFSDVLADPGWGRLQGGAGIRYVF